MVTQLLFGEHFEILEEKKNWTLIRVAYDGYECWIDKKQFLPLHKEKGWNDVTTAVTTDILQLAEHELGAMIPITIGSSLPNFGANSFSFEKEKYSFEGEVSFPFAKKKTLTNGENLGRAAQWYLNAPYLWGGRSPFGMDCSGLTQMVCKLNGIKLKRDAWQQAEGGETLNFLEEVSPGDLAFFDNENGKIVHVGIIVKPNRSISKREEEGELQIIHASGKVRIDKLDHHGIYNQEIQKYTHKLRVVKRVA